MDIIQAIEERHAVRSYKDKEIEPEKVEELNQEIEKCNKLGNLNIQLILNEPKAFTGFMAHYGKFNNVKNYIALVAPKTANLEEHIGYYGERLVLKAQQMGLNTCWVAGTYKRRKCACKINSGEKLVCVIAIGYGEDQGIPHKSKPMEELCKIEGNAPKWFEKGMHCAMLAPTAMNQQKFLFTFDGKALKLQALKGTLTKIDLGIVTYHFELGSGLSIKK